MNDADARLIGLDWGTSALRAYLLGDDGTVLAARAYAEGILAIPDGNFAAVFAAVTGDWRREIPDLPVIAAGMIGSSEGWVRAPYCRCPAGSREIAAALVALDTPDDGRLWIVPGVELRDAAPNVMRGEETQVVGALALRPALGDDTLLILPGTHAKWVEVDAARMTRFDTYMTGELYAVLSEHSILGRPARSVPRGAASAGDRAFSRGVERARDGGERGIAPLLFLTRSLVLSDEIAAEDSLEFLSGLLIGDELRSALTGSRRKIALIGAAALCARYEKALTTFGFANTPIVDDAAPAGLWQIARQAGLVMPGESR